MTRFRSWWIAGLLLGLCSLSLPSTSNAQDDDWSITRRPGPSRPNRPARPNRPSRPSRPSRPTANPEPTTNAPNTPDRRSAIIARLTESVLRDAAEDSGRLAVLMRLVRERDGSIDALVTDFERRASSAGNVMAPHLALGHLYAEAGRHEDALREYQLAARAGGDAPAPHRSLGALYRRMDRRDDARASFARALEHSRTPQQQSEVLRILIELALDARDVPTARTYHTRLSGLDRTSNTVRRELADALLQRQMFAEAVEEFRSLARAVSGDNRVLPPVLRDLGRALTGQHNYEEALTTFRRALSLAGADAGVRRELYEAITEVYTQRNALPEWITELQRMGVSRDGYERSMLLGRLQEQAGNSTGSVEAYRQAIRLRPQDVDARVRIAQLYHQQGQRNEEIAEYRRLIELAPREPDFVIKLVDLLLGEGRRDEAFRIVAQASARAGGDVNMHERLAEVYSRSGRQQDALREIRIVSQLDPTSPQALEALGRQYMELNNRELALATWRRILETARDRARGAVTLAEIYAENSMLQEAVEMYREAVRLRPTELDFHRGLAQVLERTRQFDEAVVEWRRVLELASRDRDLRRHARESIVRIWGMQNRLAQYATTLDANFSHVPPDLESGRDLAEVYLRLRRTEDAERVLRRITELDATDVGTMVQLERVLSARGELAEAITLLRRLVEADPRRAREWYQRMAQHAMTLHRDDEAIEYATHMVQLNDQDATAHLRLAALYRARNRMDSAIASLRRALELNDRLFPTYFELADLYLVFRDAPRDAVALYRRVIQLAPDDDYVGRAGRRAIQIAPAAGLGEELERDLSTAAAGATRPIYRRLLVTYYDAVARPLINRLQQGTPEEAASARAALNRMGARALAPMLDALADTDTSQQRIALDILGYLGNPNAASALLALAEGTGPSEVRLRALAAAGALGDVRSLSRLQLLQQNRELAIATTATWGLGHLRTPGATAALVRTLTSDSPIELRTMAALGLIGSRDPRARTALRTNLQARGDEVLRSAIVLALGANDRAVQPLLLAAMRGGSRDLRRASALALGAGEASVVAPVLAQSLFGADPVLRRASARALAQLAGAGSALELRSFDNPNLASNARRMLAALTDGSTQNNGGARAVIRFSTELTAALRDALTGLEERPPIALAALAEPGALLPLATNEEIRSVPGANEALEAIVTRVVPTMGTLLTHQNPTLRRAVVRVLEHAPATVASPLLATAAEDSDESIAVRAIEAMERGASGNTEGIEALLRAAQRVDAWAVRAAAMQALGRRSTPAGRETLLRALREDTFAYVRAATARALQQNASDPTVQTALERASREDSDQAVRNAARGGPEPTNPTPSE